MNILADVLKNKFEEIYPMDFYREIFPVGELDKKDAMTKGKYTGVAIEITNEKRKDGRQLIRRYTVTDELDQIAALLDSDNFCVLAPISYIGKNRKNESARIMYALIVELDDLIVKGDEQFGLDRLMTQWTERVYWIPKPTYTVASGTGLHLYYLFEKPIPLFTNVVSELKKFKRELTEKIWNRNVTTSTGNKIQQETIFQAFRMVGTITKKGDRVHAFRTGEPVTIEYMNKYVHKENRITMIYKSKLTLEQAEKKYPDWYQKRIVKGDPKGHWTCKRDLYDWWKRRITDEAVVGHRYYCLMMLVIYAIKCNIDRVELESDCFELMRIFEERTDNENNHFTEKDVIDALQSFEDKELVTYPVNSMANRSGIEIKKNKRNYRKLKTTHQEYRRGIKSLKIQLGENENWDKGGRPKGSGTKEDIVKKWREKNPIGRKIDCINQTKLSKATVYKWW